MRQRTPFWWIEPDAKRLLRLAIDPSSGRLATAIDTVLSGRVTSRFDVSADGTALLVGEPTYSADMYALEFRDLLRGETPAADALRAQRHHRAAGD